MKKILVLVMTALLLVGTTACGNKNKENGQADNNKATVQKNEKNEEDKNENKEEASDEVSEEKENDEQADKKEEDQPKDKRDVCKISVDKMIEAKEFEVNNDLKFDDNKSYKYSELKSSKELLEDKGFDFEGDFYSDKYNAIGTVVNFNKAWLRYINDNNKDVFSYVQDNSEAYDDLSRFNRTNLKEKFLLFEIGEVRTAEINGTEYTYVWTHEKIEEIRNGKKTIREYKWIYRMKRMEMDYKIISFTEDKASSNK